MSRTFTSSDQEIVVGKGEAFVIELEANPTTGYQWELHFDKDKIEKTDRQYEPAGANFGGGGKERFVLKPVKGGQTSVRATYKRPWEHEPLEERTFKIKITK